MVGPYTNRGIANARLMGSGDFSINDKVTRATISDLSKSLASIQDRMAWSQVRSS
jgi:hypothetical protein